MSYCWAMAGRSPSAPRLRRAAISGSRLPGPLNLSGPLGLPDLSGPLGLPDPLDPLDPLDDCVLVMGAIVPRAADAPRRCPQAPLLSTGRTRHRGGPVGP